MQVAHAICRWHHERWDGNGYPDRLKGDEIPIAAQVVALADVYDALTSERCYKHAYDHDTALRMILNGECDDLPESAFLFAGTIDDVFAKAKKG